MCRSTARRCGQRGRGGAAGAPYRSSAGRDGADVPDGDVGEIWLRGPSVTPGYWHGRPKLPPRSAMAGIRTGDLARREPNGFYHVVDRLKDMYVSGGENVYPAEVEAVLTRASGCRRCRGARHCRSALGRVRARASSCRGLEHRSIAAPLAAHCAARLAKYKCPARFVAIDAIPRSAAGKILKPVLRERLNRWRILMSDDDRVWSSRPSGSRPSPSTGRRSAMP